jgi:kumamolisin
MKPATLARMLFQITTALTLALGAGHGACKTDDAQTLAEPGSPYAGAYGDLGAADPSTPFRGFIAFAERNEAQLSETLEGLYAPGNPLFRRYLTSAEYLDRFAPLKSDVETVRDWLLAQGFVVPRLASNRLMLEFTGTVSDFSRVFGAEIHLYSRANKETSRPLKLLGTVSRLSYVGPIAALTRGVVSIEPAASLETISSETTTPAPPLADPSLGIDPSRVRSRYGIPADARGAGSIGIVIAQSFRLADVRSFWTAFGIEREDPVVVNTAEAPTTRVFEAALDIEWAGAIAPGAKLIVYRAPDIHESALLFAMNEAIGRAEVTVVSDSFVHRESTVTVDIAKVYEASARMASALGITVE